MPRSRHQARHCRARRAAVDLAADALAGDANEVARLRQRPARAPAPRRRWRRPADARCERSSAGGELQQIALVDIRRAGTTATTRGLPSVSVPVLSTTSVSTFSMRSSASAIGSARRRRAPLPIADHDRHRRRQAQRAGAGDDEHRDGGDQRVGEAQAAGPRPPRRRTRRSATAITAGTNQPATTSARRWIGARVRCASRDHGDDAGEHGVRRRPGRRA